MPFVKVVKTRAYHMRYQVKYRRRRDCKTDYQQRRALTLQDKNKYNTPKYRFVVRLTNKDIVCQVVYAKIIGDQTICAAYAHELPNYGVPVGLTNYSAAYCTGLLCARRLLQKLGLDKQYVGQEPKKLGDFYKVKKPEEGNKPFVAYLDIGLARTTTGARIFGALKGAVDGGVAIPHSNKRLGGCIDGKYNPKEARKVILGSHVSAYMKHLEESNEEKYKRQFSQYIKHGITPDGLEKVYLKAHENIRKNPVHTKKAPKADPVKKRYRKLRLSTKQRRDRTKQRITHGLAKLQADE